MINKIINYKSNFLANFKGKILIIGFFYLLVKNKKNKKLILSIVFGLHAFISISILLLNRIEYVTHNLETILMFYLASLWLWIGPVMIWTYETKVIPEFLSKIEKVLKYRKDYRTLKKKYYQTTPTTTSRLFIFLWVLFVTLIFINSFPFMKKFGLVDSKDLYWYMQIINVVLYSYLTSVGFILAIKTILIFKDISIYNYRIDLFSSDEKGGFAFIGKFATTTSLMLSSGALFIPILLEVYAYNASSSNNEILILILIGIYVVTIIMSFFYPIYFFHKKISFTKNRYLSKVGNKISRYKKMIIQDNLNIYPKYKIYKDEYIMISKLTTWPFNINNFVTVTLSFLLPIFLTWIQIYTSAPK